MENKFRRKLKKYSSFNNVQNGGTVTIALEDTQKGLLKTIVRMKKINVPPTDSLNKTFDKLNFANILIKTLTLLIANYQKTNKDNNVEKISHWRFANCHFINWYAIPSVV